MIAFRVWVSRVTGGESLHGAAFDDRNLVTRELILGEQIAHFHLYEIEKLGIIHHVALVHEDDHRRHADLTGEQDVLTGLRHRAVRGGHHEDRAVHLGGAGDHVLDVVSMPGAIDVRVVALVALVLHVSGIDRDAAFFFFRSSVDLVVLTGLSESLFRENSRDGRRESGLAVINVADGADVHVRFGAFELGLGHEVRWVGLVCFGCG
jgi:hypothetical protein